MKESRQTIGVFFGGQNPEHDVSIITGQLIVSALESAGRQVMPVYISTEGIWYASSEMNSVEFFRNPQKETILQKIGNYSLDISRSQDRIVLSGKGILSKDIVIDIAFPAFHGINGEDGTMQGLFELCNTPYIGCDVAASAITMSKVLTKLFYQGANIPTVPFVHFTQEQWEADQEAVVQNINTHLDFPLIIKPPHLGSSIGITKANDSSELLNGIDVALHYDTTCLVEKCIAELLDVTCCVLGNDTPQASLLQESVFGDDVFSYDDKYMKGGGAQLGKAQGSIIIPAHLDKKTTEAIQKMSIQIFSLLGCSGIARIDFLYDKKNTTFYANEVNALPGTLYHHLWKKSGISLEDLVLKLVELAEDQHKKNNTITSTFTSNILQNTNSTKLQNSS